jgi:hypothetical protein
VSASTFEADVRELGGSSISKLTFRTTPSTVFQIDGVPLVGMSGLSKLASTPAGTSMQVFGAADPNSERFDADYVEVGSGTFNGGSDIVDGFIVERTGGLGTDVLLTVCGQSTDEFHAFFDVNTAFLVSTSFASTKVVREGASTLGNTNDLNIGQHVRVFGTLAGTTLTATGTKDVVRLKSTDVFGRALGPASGVTLRMELLNVGLRRAIAFNWADGGGTPPDPLEFELDVGPLANGLGIVTDTPTAARGFFTAVNDPNADFFAETLENAATSDVVVLVRDVPAVGIDVDVTGTAGLIELSISGTPSNREVAVVQQGFVMTVPLPRDPAPTFFHVGPGSYSLRDRDDDSVRLFTSFTQFAAALEHDTALGATLVQFGAAGVYDAVANSLDASTASAVID